METKYHRKKRNFLINYELQGKYIFKTFILFIICALLFTLFLGLITLNTQTMVYEGYQLKMGTTPMILWKQMIYGNWIFIVLGGIVLIVFSTLLTHRFAGPLYRFEKCLNKMIAGDLSDKIYLRGKDEGKQLSIKINEFNEKLSMKVKTMQTISKSIEAELAGISKNESSISPSDNSKAQFEKIVRLNSDLRSILYEFSTLD